MRRETPLRRKWTLDTSEGRRRPQKYYKIIMGVFPSLQQDIITWITFPDNMIKPGKEHFNTKNS